MSCTHNCGCTEQNRNASLDEWPTTAWLQGRAAKEAPADASQAPAHVQPAPEPSEPVFIELATPIKPEDVRVGMLVERRKGENYAGGRVKSIDGSYIGLDTSDAVVWAYGAYYAKHGWSLWLVEDAPAPVDPDAADRQCAWVDYRKDYGVGEPEMAAAHKAFMAGWKSAREGDQSGPLR